MKRFVGLRIVVAVAAALAVAALGALPAGAGGGQSACKLLTKKQASKALGVKVVTTERLTEGDVEGCDYVTKKQFKDLQSPMKLQVTVQPLTPATQDILTQLEADEETEPVDGLGDKAFYTSGDDLVAVVGDRVFQVEVTNVKWKGSEQDTLIRDPERAAMEKVLAKAEAS